MSEPFDRWRCTLPCLNERAPEFEAKTTQGVVRLSDYRGRWLLFFSHPADFTPICTSEFVALSRRFPEFQSIGCDLLGLSVDSRFSHLAWLQNIQEKFGVTVPFPVIEDVAMKVATLYGMVHPGASAVSAVRSLFIIDPEGILRALTYYPMNVGRSIDEQLRLIQALQAVDRYGVALPEGWHPGDKAVLPPPSTTGELKDRIARPGPDYADWYFCKTDLEAAPSPALPA